MPHPLTSHLRSYTTAATLATLLGFSAPALADQSKAPTALDVMKLLMQGSLEAGIDSEQIFTTGVLANMRIPPEHLRVAFIDTRSGEPVSRDDRRHILGQSRQDGAHEILRLAASQFNLPGFELDVLIDLFDAAALASMRRPPQHVSIEFYDQRSGPEGSQRGGISGQTPDYVFTPEEGLQEPTAAAPPSRAEVLREWTDLRVSEHFLSQGYRFTGQANQALSPFRNFAANEQAFRRELVEEFNQLEELASEYFGHPVRVDDIRLEQLDELEIPGQPEKLYVSLIRITGSSELIQVTREQFSELH